MKSTIKYLQIISLSGLIILFFLSILAFIDYESLRIKPTNTTYSGISLIISGSVYLALFIGCTIYLNRERISVCHVEDNVDNISYVDSDHNVNPNINSNNNENNENKKDILSNKSSNKGNNSINRITAFSKKSNDIKKEDNNNNNKITDNEEILDNEEEALFSKT